MQPTPIQRIVLVVIIVFMVASIILGLVYPNDPVIVAVRMFAFGAMFGGFATLAAGRRKPS
jgi:RsiW-degrading membrane proteinase PrsW (M82 family)